MRMRRSVWRVLDRVNPPAASGSFRTRYAGSPSTIFAMPSNPDDPDSSLVAALQPNLPAAYRAALFEEAARLRHRRGSE